LGCVATYHYNLPPARFYVLLASSGGVFALDERLKELARSYIHR
jgi:hypothetical protein